jgi:hypothetical protein
MTEIEFITLSAIAKIKEPVKIKKLKAVLAKENPKINIVKLVDELKVLERNGYIKNSMTQIESDFVHTITLTDEGRARILEKEMYTTQKKEKTMTQTTEKTPAKRMGRPPKTAAEKTQTNRAAKPKFEQVQQVEQPTQNPIPSEPADKIIQTGQQPEHEWIIEDLSGNKIIGTYETEQDALQKANDWVKANISSVKISKITSQEIGVISPIIEVKFTAA